MYTVLSDRLTCPRCGPGFGLILLARRVRNQRALAGELGCGNCRDAFPVEEGFADLRPPPRRPLPAPGDGPAPADREEAFRLAALLGVKEGPGILFVAGPSVRTAPGVAEIVEGIEVAAADAGLRGWREEHGVTRLAVEGRIPFQSGSLRGTALSGEAGEALLEEAARVTGPGGRVVVVDAGADAPDRLEGEGLDLLLVADEGVVVAARE